MSLDDEVCYRALSARDRRFDGVFFVGVSTTGIYCRPICPARTPGRDRCRFFTNAAAAEQGKFRPCLRCRPELAPGDAPVDAVGRTARTAAARIAAGAMNDAESLETLALEMGIGGRQLRRVVQQEFGVSPVRLAQTHRLLLAKQLLAETRLPIIEVAFASGFASLRRFNALFRSHYRLTPRDLRRQNADEVAGDVVRLTLSYRPPLAWDRLLAFLAKRTIAGVEAIVGRSYWRTAAVGDNRGWVMVEPVEGKHVLAVEFPSALLPGLSNLLARLRNLFDLDARPDVIAGRLEQDPRLAGWVRDQPGLRVPGAFDGFEMAVRAVVGQQVSVRAASTMAGRLSKEFAAPIETPFPMLTSLGLSAARVANADVRQLTGLGLVGARAECILALARAVCDGRLSLEPSPNPELAIERLQAVPGVGPWTAHYIAMRALRWPDAFPHGDLVLRKALGEKSPRDVLKLSEAWRPWRAYAAMHVWNAAALAIEKGSKND